MSQRIRWVAGLAALWVCMSVNPAAAVCPGLDVLIQDQFDELQPTWGEPGPAVRIEDGRVVLSPVAGTEAWIVNNAGLYDDIDMCVTITTVTGGEETESKAGSIFWYQDVNNFYVFELAPNGRASVWRRQRGRWLVQIDWRDAEAANAGDDGINELRVTTVGEEATFYVNGAEFATLEGTPPANGQQIGLFAGSPDDSEAAFSFDGLRVTRP
jgi:hypothetical protein